MLSRGEALEDLAVERVFESFFTTKASGMGMGLPICRSILESYGGAISSSNASEGGAVFVFTLPAAR